MFSPAGEVKNIEKKVRRPGVKLIKLTESIFAHGRS